VLCPLRVRGRSLGVIVIVNKQGDAVFDSRDTLLLQALADQAAITVDLVNLYDVLGRQQRLEQELEIAHEFQSMLLPQRCPTLEGFEFSALSDSALVVGGDFYDFFPIGQDRLAIAIGDVSGKGIPGALIMAMVRSILRAEARDTLSPKEAMRRVNKGLLNDTKDNVFVTITYGILDITNRRFRFTRAGHEPALMRSANHDSNVRVIRPEGMALGLMPPEYFDLIEEVEIQLQPGDAFLLYTDGVIEAINPASEEYGRDRLIQFFSTYADKGPEALLKNLITDIHKFAGGTPQHDDITLVAFRVSPIEKKHVEPEPGEVARTVTVAV
jgi:sigma-B regulation protein RsbU (phosphoserine phosphatase)